MVKTVRSRFNPKPTQQVVYHAGTPSTITHDSVLYVIFVIIAAGIAIGSGTIVYIKYDDTPENFFPYQSRLSREALTSAVAAWMLLFVAGLAIGRTSAFSNIVSSIFLLSFLAIILLVYVWPSESLVGFGNQDLVYFSILLCAVSSVAAVAVSPSLFARILMCPAAVICILMATSHYAPPV